MQPHSDGESYPIHLVKSLTDEPSYDQISLSAFLSSDETFFSCLSPTCKAGQLHPGGTEEPIFSCSSCKTRSCFACKVLWHEGRTCVQYQEDLAWEQNTDQRAKETKKQEEASEVAVKAVSKVCPNAACGARIEKISGCDHMVVSLILSCAPCTPRQRPGCAIVGVTVVAGIVLMSSQCSRCHHPFNWSTVPFLR